MAMAIADVVREVAYEVEPKAADGSFVDVGRQVRRGVLQGIEGHAVVTELGQQAARLAPKRRP